MNLTDALILGIMQGLTEFLPVSSSGHLVLVERLMGIRSADISFPVAVHVGTLIAVVIYFRSHIAAILAAFVRHRQDVPATARPAHDPVTERRMVLFLIVGSIPAGIVGVLFKDRIEMAFAAPLAAALFLMVTGLWLLLSRLFPTGGRSIGWRSACWIGVAQGAAVIPGISRSGSTIATGMILGVRPVEAAEFSFLLSIPTVFGATLLSMPKALAEGQLGSIHLTGLIAAAITGYLALRLLFATIRRGRFGWFGVYCLLAGGSAAIWLR